VDLSKADTVGDLQTAIQNAIPGLTVGFAGGSLTITSSSPTANITVQEVGSGTCAKDLGILNPTGAGVGVPLTGSSVKPNITPLTALSQLASGASIDLSGLKITNGSTSATIALSSSDTVQDLLNKINSAGLGVQASISDDGTYIQVVNMTQGAAMTIGENGGTTATDLGIRTFSPSTKLSDLNGGRGVGTNNAGDLRITDSNGTAHLISLSSAKTVQDVLDTINTQCGGQIQASFATNGNGIVLQDIAGGSGTMKVESANYSTAMKDLGLNGTVSGNTLTGKDVSGVNADGVFAHLQALRNAMLKGDQGAMTTAAAALQGDWNRTARIRGQLGARVQEIESRQTRMDDENVSTKSLISSLRDVDFTEAVTKYQNLQTTLQATLQTSGKMLNMSLLDFLG
jgi:flagellar hook-associated protein 3 FlgL